MDKDSSQRTNDSWFVEKVIRTSRGRIALRLVCALYVLLFFYGLTYLCFLCTANKLLVVQFLRSFVGKAGSEVSAIIVLRFFCALLLFMAGSVVSFGSAASAFGVACMPAILDPETDVFF